MINPVNPLSLYTFDLELLLFVGIFSFRLDKQSLFPLRLFVSLALIAVYTVLWDFGDGSLLVDIPCYALLFLLLIGLVYFCFDIPFFSALFIATAGYACQHFSYKAIQLLLLWIETMAPGVRENAVLANAIYFLFYLFFLPLFYFLFARHIRPHDDRLMDNRRTILIAMVLLIGATTLNLVFEENIDPFRQSPLFIVCSFYDLLCALLALLFLFRLFSQGKMAREYRERRKLWEQEKKQLQVNKENFDYLMILAHDLKHVVEDIGASDQEGRVKALNERLMAFGKGLKTGSEPLDLVLAERRTRMDALKIDITVMADGKCLSFMRPTDVYTLFMNLLDNAMEALAKVDDPARRTISLSVKEEMGLVFVHEENPYQEEVRFLNGQPLTSKDDGMPHGLGVSSMRRIAGSYGGEITCRALDAVFVVDIALDPSKRLKEETFD